MNRLNDDNLIKLGFIRHDVTEEESGGNAFHYYTLDLIEGECLISNSSDECETEGIFKVELFNTGLGVCETDSDVMILYKSLMGKYLETDILYKMK